MIEFFKDLWAFMKVRKKFWMAPILIILVIIGLILVVAEKSAIAQFLYTL